MENFLQNRVCFNLIAIHLLSLLHYKTQSSDIQDSVAQGLIELRLPVSSCFSKVNSAVGNGSFSWPCATLLLLFL